MADQAERVILEAEDQVTPVVGQANAGLDSFEKKAESAHGKVIRITDQTRSSIQRLIASLEKQAEVYGKSGVDRLISQRDQLLQRYAKEPAAIDAITKSYEKMIAVEEKAAREAAVAKAAKEAEEALRSQSEAIKSFGDRVGQFMENPLQGAQGRGKLRALVAGSVRHGCDGRRDGTGWLRCCGVRGGEELGRVWHPGEGRGVAHRADREGGWAVRFRRQGDGPGHLDRRTPDARPLAGGG